MNRHRRLVGWLCCGLVAVAHGGCQPRPGGTVPPHREVTSPSGVPMVWLAGGEFSMGSDRGGPDERPVHVVRVSPFVIDRFEVTQDQFAALELPNPSQFKGPRRPVEQVRWSDAALFCNERSRAEGLEPCYDEVTFDCNFDANGYRLPTEAEWEFAARGGDDRDLAANIAASSLPQQACYAGNSPDRTEPVGRRRGNAFGLHDMLGNVREWCQDRYGAEYYATSTASDPRGPEEGSHRVLRGGSWKSSADVCRVAARAADNPGISDACFGQNTTGFRCVRRPNAEELRWIEGSPADGRGQ